MLAVSLPLVAFTPRPRPHGPASMRSWGPQAGPSKPPPMSTSEAPNGELLGDVVGDTSNEATGSEVKVEETVHARPSSPPVDILRYTPDEDVQVLEKEADVDTFLIPDEDDAVMSDVDEVDELNALSSQEQSPSGLAREPVAQSSTGDHPAEDTEGIPTTDNPFSLSELEARSLTETTLPEGQQSNTPARRRSAAVPRIIRPSTSTFEHGEAKPRPKRVPKPTDKVKAMSISAPPPVSSAKKPLTITFKNKGKENGTGKPPGKRRAEVEDALQVEESVSAKRPRRGATTRSQQIEPEPIPAPEPPVDLPPAPSPPPSISAPPPRVGPPSRRKKARSTHPTPNLPAPPPQEGSQSGPQPEAEAITLISQSRDLSASPPPSNPLILDINAMETSGVSLEDRYITLRAAYLSLSSYVSSTSSPQTNSGDAGAEVQELRQRLAHANTQLLESEAEIQRTRRAFGQEMTQLQRRLEDVQAREAWFVKERGEMLRRLGMLFGFGGMGLGVGMDLGPGMGPMGPPPGIGAGPSQMFPPASGLGGLGGPAFEAGPSNFGGGMFAAPPVNEAPAPTASTSTALVPAGPSSRPSSRMPSSTHISTVNGALGPYGAVSYQQLARVGEQSQAPPPGQIQIQPYTPDNSGQ
ncbi:hypothetical protein CVT26_002561 [Gymnopilus dilepis]|uniref:Uncharacterized protein n=1 Tax=Gymnopilus dilepis TaxID=231916 RepID=A0A409VSY9_9AGAR|nr:hypothetical protein CVT26_002561 [Gymnopilus dilepis]